MDCLNKYLKGLVYIETGENASSVSKDSLWSLFLLIPWALSGLHRKTACIVFMGVWYG